MYTREVFWYDFVALLNDIAHMTVKIKSIKFLFDYELFQNVQYYTILLDINSYFFTMLSTFFILFASRTDMSSKQGSAKSLKDLVTRDLVEKVCSK